VGIDDRRVEAGVCDSVSERPQALLVERTRQLGLLARQAELGQINLGEFHFRHGASASIPVSYAASRYMAEWTAWTASAISGDNAKRRRAPTFSPCGRRWPAKPAG